MLGKTTQLVQAFLKEKWPMKIVFVWAWLSVVIMICALFSPYFQAVVETFPPIFS